MLQLFKIRLWKADWMTTEQIPGELCHGVSDTKLQWTRRPKMPRLVNLLLHLSQAGLIMAYTWAACSREQMDAGLVWTSPLSRQGCNGWIQTTHNKTQRSTKHWPKTQQWSSSKKYKPNKNIEHGSKSRHRPPAHSAELEQTHTRCYSFSNGEYLHTQRALFSGRLVPLCSSIADRWLNSAIPWEMFFWLPQWCKRLNKWGMQQGRPMLLTVCPNSAHRLKLHNPDLSFI